MMRLNKPAAAATTPARRPGTAQVEKGWGPGGLRALVGGLGAGVEPLTTARKGRKDPIAPMMGTCLLLSSVFANNALVSMPCGDNGQV